MIVCANAAIGYAGITGYYFSGRRDETLVALLEEALGALPPGDSEMRVRLLARLSVALYWSDLDGSPLRAERGGRGDGQTVARSGDPGDGDPQPTVRPMGTGQLRAASRRRQRSAGTWRSRPTSSRLAVSASRWRFTDLLEDGDVAAADHELDSHAELAERLHQPFLLAHTTQFRALRAIMQGRFRDGEALAEDARLQAQRAGNPLAGTVHGAQMFPVWWQRGEHEQLDAFLRTALRRPRHIRRRRARWR